MPLLRRHIRLVKLHGSLWQLRQGLQDLPMGSSRTEATIIEKVISLFNGTLLTDDQVEAMPIIQDYPKEEREKLGKKVLEVQEFIL